MLGAMPSPAGAGAALPAGQSAPPQTGDQQQRQQQQQGQPKDPPAQRQQHDEAGPDPGAAAAPAAPATPAAAPADAPHAPAAATAPADAPRAAPAAAASADASYDDGELEPQLKYERLGGSVKAILSGTQATCLAVSEKVLALGTAAGSIHLLDYDGNEVGAHTCCRWSFCAPGRPSCANERRRPSWMRSQAGAARPRQSAAR